MINRFNVISDLDKNAILAVRERGVKVALCTGRVYLTARKILKTLNLDGYHIFFDGALVCDHSGGSELYCQPIPAEIAKTISRLALDSGIALDFYSLNHFYVMSKSWRSDIRKEYFDLDAEITDFETLWRRDRLIKGTLVFKTSEDEISIRKYLSVIQNSLNTSWSTIPAYPDCHFVNLVDAGVSKGKALEALSRYYHIELNEIMAIGDGSNDIPLLSTAGIAVAMQNAPDTLKAEADYITNDVEHHGVAEAIKRFIL